MIRLIGSFFPLTLYTSKEQLQEIIHNPAAYSALFLLLLVAVKALLTSTSFASGSDCGPIFLHLFIGATLGLAISQIFPFIPRCSHRIWWIIREALCEGVSGWMFVNGQATSTGVRLHASFSASTSTCFLAT